MATKYEPGTKTGTGTTDKPLGQYNDTVTGLINLAGGLLKKEEDKPKDTPRTPTPAKTNYTPYIIGGGALVLVLVLVLVFSLRKGK